MGINERDYMRSPRRESAGRMPHRRGDVSLWSRFRFGLWLVIRKLSVWR